MWKIIDLTGKKFNRLTAVRLSHRDNSGRAWWIFRCECGKEKAILGANASGGYIKSCGCLRHEVCKSRVGVHRMSRSKIYAVWHSMKNRCLNSKDRYFQIYGGRGIKVCEEWLLFETFAEWASTHGYKDGLTLDRVDNNGEYKPDNCRWATWVEQANNKSNNVILTYEGETMTLKRWAERYDVNYYNLKYRLRAGWSARDALFGKIKKGAT